MPDIDSSAVSGVEVGGYRRGATSGDPWHQYVVPVQDRIVSFRGRACSFRQLGIAGTAGQKLASIFNAAGSSVIVDVELIAIDVIQTAARVVEPPVIRAHKITTAPTGGTAKTKIGEDSTMTSSSSVTLLQGTASEGGAATAIVSTPAANTIVNQEVAPRALTLVGYEQFDRIEWFDNAPWTLRAGEGLLINLDYSAATANPVTDKWITTIRWSEYTRP
jgi:hypothetical protein